jgi:hypothetical protein
MRVAHERLKRAAFVSAVGLSPHAQCIICTWGVWGDIVPDAFGATWGVAGASHFLLGRATCFEFGAIVGAIPLKWRYSRDEIAVVMSASAQLSVGAYPSRSACQLLFGG